MPDFSHPGALVHYTLENLLQRSQKATAALLLDEARPLLEELFCLLSTTSRGDEKRSFKAIYI